MANASDRIYHVAHGGRKFGPLSLADLSAKRLSHDMLVWCEGMPEWVPIAEIPDLQPYVRHAAAVRRVAPPAGGGMQMLQPDKIEPIIDPGNGGKKEAGFRPPPPPASAGRVRFVAITTIALASLGLLVCPFSLWVTRVGAVPGFIELGPAPGMQADEALDRAKTPKSVVYGAMLVASLAMLIGGIGLLMRRRWAAVMLIICSIFCITVHVSGFFVDVAFLYGPMLMQVEADASAQFKGALIGGIIGSAVVMLAGVGWHVTSLFLVNASRVRGHLR